MVPSVRRRGGTRPGPRADLRPPLPAPAAARYRSGSGRRSGRPPTAALHECRDHRRQHDERIGIRDHARAGQIRSANLTYEHRLEHVPGQHVGGGVPQGPLSGSGTCTKSRIDVSVPVRGGGGGGGCTRLHTCHVRRGLKSSLGAFRWGHQGARYSNRQTPPPIGMSVVHRPGLDAIEQSLHRRCEPRSCRRDQSRHRPAPHG
jgi:hypothetical protein